MQKKIDRVVDEVAIQLGVSGDMLYDLMMHQFHSANRAIAAQKSVEISGLCSLRIRENKRLHKLMRYEQFEQGIIRKSELLPEGDPRKETLDLKLSRVREDIKLLKNEP